VWNTLLSALGLCFSYGSIFTGPSIKAEYPNLTLLLSWLSDLPWDKWVVPPSPGLGMRNGEFFHVGQGPFLDEPQYPHYVSQLSITVINA
jgi:hypothetical protein